MWLNAMPNWALVVDGCRHPAECRVPDLPLDVRNDLTGIRLVPPSVQLLCGQAELDDEVAR
jgi:hypothetical protein